MTPDPTRSRPAALARPRVVVLAALLAAGIAVVAGRRPWLTGLVDDATLGRTSVGATGSQAVPGLVALALVIAAAALAAATSGPCVAAPDPGPRQRRVARPGVAGRACGSRS